MEEEECEKFKTNKKEIYLSKSNWWFLVSRMEDDELNLMILMNCGAFMTIMEYGSNKKNRRKMCHWVSPYLKARNEKGRFATDFENLRNDPARFVENFRMPPCIFDELWEMLEPHLLPKRNSRPKDFIPAKAKFAIVLEYLASGDLQRHIASCYRISKQHFGRIVSDVCKAICCDLKNEIPE
ncbi:uncharacterized protein LOC128921497 [Zeugodacus cucurbitae]|uniref:uncharacterized protein LOC128921497 n=1 Tax=Zeugodacus cucurbitae TaxID=28588 RepID=UPI0023D93823|nr:uncharacterized protein LOC128921497 [Zeugodacus cucurbitae]